MTVSNSYSTLGLSLVHLWREELLFGADLFLNLHSTVCRKIERTSRLEGFYRALNGSMANLEGSFLAPPTYTESN